MRSGNRVKIITLLQLNQIGKHQFEIDYFRKSFNHGTVNQSKASCKRCIRPVALGRCLVAKFFNLTQLYLKKKVDFSHIKLVSMPDIPNAPLYIIFWFSSLKFIP